MSEKEYAVIKLPKDLADMIDLMIGRMGYKTRTEFVKDAVRRLLREYGIQEETSNTQR